MIKNTFNEVAANPENRYWDKLIHRLKELYEKDNEIRTPFERDFTRILHSNGYRRMKHKTQVFFNIDNDHVCTRMEHVAHVESVSRTIAKNLGLNEELTEAIAIGHDIGHAPFGHEGERIIKELGIKEIGDNFDFWHERNGLHFVDNVELLNDDNNIMKNLNLTYAVRDGIISHCGEIDENEIFPRKDFIDLETDFHKKGQFSPITWEGCVVKISDKIAYLGRDIEDAITLGFLLEEELKILDEIANNFGQGTVNTTTLMHSLILDICENSTPEIGIKLSENGLQLINSVKKFNYHYIYDHKRLKTYKKYTKLVIESIFNQLKEIYGTGKLDEIWHNFDDMSRCYPLLSSTFEEHLVKYCESDIIPDSKQHLKTISSNCSNNKIYNRIETKEVFIYAIIDYISGMTDRFAVKVFNELIDFKIF